MQLLTQGCEKDRIRERFQAISFIVFNYDRCIEHFLFHSLQNYYGVSAAEATDLLQALKVHHPYGQVGDLPWQVGDREGTPFGSDHEGPNLLSLAGRIKTFTERFEDEAARSEIHTLVLEAETVVFLGFAFHEENVRLIAPSPKGHVGRIFATAKGISVSDCQIAENQIRSDLTRADRIDFRNDLTCYELFGEYWRSL